ncbi:hypothetical protein [Amycolatopsis sp. FDAARGOS 1241]|uniref:hypothetical protein n=1 Tax=Amycolatopsis sp. FDAARGOS 1241 TaxID=2778070 RepID=UPI001EF1A033|nr:hypothetical protein [Amycolatopsis sp. FDAARGOS 1241]
MTAAAGSDPDRRTPEIAIPLHTQWTQVAPCSVCRHATEQTFVHRNASATRFAARCLPCGAWNVVTAAWGWASDDVLPVLLTSRQER